MAVQDVVLLPAGQRFLFNTWYTLISSKAISRVDLRKTFTVLILSFGAFRRLQQVTDS